MNISTSSIRNLLPRSMSSKQNKPNSKSKKRMSKFFNSENTPPVDPNIQFSDPPLSPSIPKPSPPSISITPLPKSDGPPEIPSPRDHRPLQGEVAGSDVQSEASASVTMDPSVKVVVRIRPAVDHERSGDQAVRKSSSDSVSIDERKFTFDSVLDSNSNQEDVFQLVGIPLVKSALAGYNASILSYGQSGSGKTYTLWGPPSAMLQDPSPCSNQGIVPRIFQMLFSEIQKEQENNQGKQVNFQCRCSFLEIYNEQIGDLLDPVQRNLEIKDDTRNGLYVENLTEEYVNSYEDVTQVLIKGLSSRKVGATSINSKSSRSHVVFTFIIESWCKGTSSKCFSSSKISRISLVDLAGLDGNKVDDDAGREFAKEVKTVKKSLSQLGKLVNMLTMDTQPESLEDATYKGSCLTHLLRESLGGNAKLTVICNVSPANSNVGETLRTLRFGQRAKSIKNEPVVNEISEDDVNDLSDQIRQLKEELIRAKSDVHSAAGSKDGYFKGRNVRESLNHLRVSLNRSLMLPRIDNDSDNEMNVDMEDVRELHEQLDKWHTSCEEDLRDSTHFSSVHESFDTELMSEDEVNGPLEIVSEVHNVQNDGDVSDDGIFSSPKSNISRAVDPSIRGSLSISPCHHAAVLQEPTLSESPKIGNTRKSMVIPSQLSASEANVSESSAFKSDALLLQSVKENEQLRSSLRSSKMFPGATESLAASLQRGLQIIDQHQRNSASTRSSVAFSFEHLTLKPSQELDKANASLQRASLLDGSSASMLCTSCKQKINDNTNEVQDSLKTWIVAVDEARNSSQPKNEVSEDPCHDLAEPGKRENELENVCKEQAAKIEQLNQLLEQYKQDKECSAVGKRNGEGLTNQIVLFEGSENEECQFPKDGNKHSRLGSNGENQPDIEKCEIKEVQEVLDRGNTYFDVKEKEELLKEIETLRNKLQTYTDASSAYKSTDKLRSSLLARSIQLRKSIDMSRYNNNNNEEELEMERQRWTEMESDWISLTDDLRIDLESARQRAEKVEMELRLEKNSTAELDDALHRSVLGHARMIEHYAELQEKYNDLVEKHKAMMEGIAEVKKAAARAGKKGGSRFAKSLAAELSALRVERERERDFLKKENKSLKIQLRDTAEAVHAAGELLVRLREAEHAASVSEENLTSVQQENEKLKKQLEKVKRKHKMEMITMKQYLAESRLPESALQPLYREDSDVAASNTFQDDDQAWRAEFGAIYQDHY